MNKLKKIVATAGATFALTGAMLVAPTVDVTHDHVDNAPATAAAHSMSTNCTHTFKRETWWTATYIAKLSSGGKHYHYYEHSNNMFPWDKHYWYTDCTWAH